MQTYVFFSCVLQDLLCVGELRCTGSRRVKGSVALMDVCVACRKTDAGQDPPAGGVQFGDAAYSCVCALGCSYQKSINALRCANGGKFVGPSGDSIFPKGLKQSEGVKGIIADSGKKKQCACICGKGNQWISTDGRAG
jgi:hypothetical protein